MCCPSVTQRVRCSTWRKVSYTTRRSPLQPFCVAPTLDSTPDAHHLTLADQPIEKSCDAIDFVPSTRLLYQNDVVPAGNHISVTMQQDPQTLPESFTWRPRTVSQYMYVYCIYIYVYLLERQCDTHRASIKFSQYLPFWRSVY